MEKINRATVEKYGCIERKKWEREKKQPFFYEKSKYLFYQQKHITIIMKIIGDLLLLVFFVLFQPSNGYHGNAKNDTIKTDSFFFSVYILLSKRPSDFN